MNLNFFWNVRVTPVILAISRLKISLEAAVVPLLHKTPIRGCSPRRALHSSHPLLKTQQACPFGRAPAFAAIPKFMR